MDAVQRLNAERGRIGVAVAIGSGEYRYTYGVYGRKPGKILVEYEGYTEIDGSQHGISGRAQPVRHWQDAANFEVTIFCPACGGADFDAEGQCRLCTVASF